MDEIITTHVAIVDAVVLQDGEPIGEVVSVLDAANGTVSVLLRDGAVLDPNKVITVTWMRTE